MAKVIAPLMSMRASGTVARSMTYLSWNGINVCRQWRPLKNSRTIEQLKEQYRMKRATDTWHTESGTIQTRWDNYVKTHHFSETGFNLYVGAFIKYMVQNSDSIPSVRGFPPTMS